MKWAINKNGENTGTVFDDGIPTAAPGDEGFTREHIDAHLAELGEGFTADWVGITWPPEPEPEG